MNSNFHNKGFTLLEVLIAITLLVVISLSIFQAVTETYHLRDVLMNEGDFHNGIRLSMGILERDFSQLYSPLLILPSKTSTDKTSAEPQNLQETLSQFWSSPTDKTGIRPSRFIGTENKISFIAVSHIRTYKDAPESEFVKIIYELKPDKTPVDPGISSNSLIKTENTDAFSDDSRIEKTNHLYPLLKGITRFKYRYYRAEKEQWFTSWDSDHEDFKNSYPDILEVTLEVRGPSRLFFEGTYKFRPEIPLHGLSPST